MHVTAFTKYDREAASTRQRLLQYLPALKAAGISVDYRPLLGEDYVRSLATGGRFSRTAVAAAYLRRLKDLAASARGDIIWIYAELFPYLPAAFERLAFISGRPVIYDFDDAFFHTYDSSPRPIVRKLMAGKLEPLLSGAAACCCGNNYLAAYAKHFCDNSIILPTVVDTTLYARATRAGSAPGPVTIGWIGSPSTWPYMKQLLPLLADIARKHDVRVRVVGAGPAARSERFEQLDLVDWREETEVEDVQAMDIGVMPLDDDLWARGKSGYKLVQYMACGLPVVASPVGVNSEMIDHGANGYLATGWEEWRSALLRLIGDAALRQRFGAAGRQRVVERYSLQAHAPRFVELIQSLAVLKQRR